MKSSSTRTLLGIGSLLLAGCGADDYDSTVIVSLTGQTEAEGEVEVCVEVAYEAHCFGCENVTGLKCKALVLENNTSGTPQELVATLWVEPLSTDPSADEPKSLTTELRLAPNDAGTRVRVKGFINKQSAIEPHGDGTSTVSVEATYTP
jgi:hypothetical protein